MKEDFLYYLWRLKKFDFDQLKTTDGEKIQILEFGTLNSNAGPDFLNARIKIGDTLWAGNVEMHLKASEWISHQHHLDRAYNNVILHVVLEEDLPVTRENGAALPCLELKKRVAPKLAARYKALLHNENWIPCQAHFHRVEEITKKLWLDRLMVERLEQKTQLIEQIFRSNHNDWEESFYQILARNFGVKLNGDAFELLAKSLPLKILNRFKPRLFQLEALLFGQAGMLDREFQDEYPKKLQKEYYHLRHLLTLKPIPVTSWKYMRLRPASFPTIRIAQFARLLFQSTHLFSKVIAVKKVKEIENMFTLNISNYWQNHYVFDKASGKRKKSLGKGTMYLFIINTVAPFLFFYGKQKGLDQFIELSLQLLEEVPAEKNSIVKSWHQLGFKAENAAQSQALLQLKNSYCENKKCLSCAIGNAILK